MVLSLTAASVAPASCPTNCGGARTDSTHSNLLQAPPYNPSGSSALLASDAPGCQSSYAPNPQWDNFNDGDLCNILTQHYYTYRRAVNLKKLGLDTAPWLYGDTTAAGWLIDFYDRYAEHCQYTPFLIYIEGEGYKSIPHGWRGNHGYQARHAYQLQNLSSYIDTERRPMVHVRVSPRVSPTSSPYALHLQMRKAQNDFLCFIRGHLGRKVDYIVCAEPTQRGATHYHFLFFCHHLMPERLIAEWWQNQGLGSAAGVHVDRLSPRKSCLRSKQQIHPAIAYVSKSIRGQCADKCWLAMQILTRSKAFSCSNTVQRWLLFSGQQTLEISDGLANDSLSQNPDAYFLGHPDAKLLNALYPDGKPPPNVLINDLAAVYGAINAMRNEPVPCTPQQTRKYKRRSSLRGSMPFTKLLGPRPRALHRHVRYREN